MARSKLGVLSGCAIRMAQPSWHAVFLVLALFSQVLLADTAIFDVLEYEVRGNTVLPQTSIEKAVYPYLGEKRTIADVERARASLEKAYRDAGYATVIVDIPEQAVDSGIVQLRVTEAKVSRVRVIGSHYYSQGKILAGTPSIAPGTTPRFTDFQNDLQTVNRFPGSRVTPVLRPGKDAGTTEIDLTVEDKNPLSGSVELNNRYSPNTSPLRVTGTAAYANLWQLGHTLSLQYQTAPEEPSEAKVWVGSYLMPVPDSDKLLAFYAVRSRSSVAALSDFTVIGNGDIYGARLVMPLPAIGALYHSLTLGIDYKDFQENVAQPGTPGVQTPIHYVPASVSWGGTRADARGEWQFSTGFSAGLRGAGSDELAFEDKRFKAHGNFVVWKWEVQRSEALNKSLSLVGRVDGQLADQALVSNEQFSGGGASSVRGYLESEQIGDNGVHSSFELRGPLLFGGSVQLRPLAFVEGAYLWLTDPLPGQQSEASLYSTGIGLRLSEWHRLDATLDLGIPLKSTSYTDAGQARLQFSATMKF
jgi:hemolysin activation/secretion protein